MKISELHGDSTVRNLSYDKGKVSLQFLDDEIDQEFYIEIQSNIFYSQASEEEGSVHIRINSIPEYLQIDKKSGCYTAPFHFNEQMSIVREGYHLAIGLKAQDFPYLLQIRGYSIILACPLKSIDEIQVVSIENVIIKIQIEGEDSSGLLNAVRGLARSLLQKKLCESFIPINRANVGRVDCYLFGAKITNEELENYFNETIQRKIEVEIQQMSTDLKLVKLAGQVTEILLNECKDEKLQYTKFFNENIHYIMNSLGNNKLSEIQKYLENIESLINGMSGIFNSTHDLLVYQYLKELKQVIIEKIVEISKG